MQVNLANWHACLKNCRVNEAQDLLSYKTMFANCRISTDTGRHLCLVAANRTSCRRNQWDCRAILTACCCLKSLRCIEARANVTERAVMKPTAAAFASECATLLYRGPQHSWHKLSVQDLCWTLRWQTWSQSKEWTLASLCQCGWASNHGQPTASNTINWNACIFWPIACALQPWCLCTEPQNWQLWLKELHTCKPASMLLS